MNKPTIEDVAREAGVTKGTVSHAFNGHRPISEATRQRVLTAANQLGWMPNFNARALAARKANAIGIVLARNPEVLSSDTFFPVFLAGVESVLVKNEVALTLQVVSDKAMEERAYRSMAQGHADGVIVLDLRRSDWRLPLLRDLQLHTVLTTSGHEATAIESEFSRIYVDDETPMIQLIRHLRDHGHQRIAHVSGPLDYVHAYARAHAYITEMGSRELLREGDFSAANGVSCTKELLGLPDPPTAIIYANDVMAIAGLSYAHSIGLVIPDDLAVAGFDDDPISAHLSPPMTSVSTNSYHRGQLAAQRLLADIRGEEPESIESDSLILQLRASTGDA